RGCRAGPVGGPGGVGSEIPRLRHHRGVLCPLLPPRPPHHQRPPAHLPLGYRSDRRRLPPLPVVSPSGLRVLGSGWWAEGGFSRRFGPPLPRFAARRPLSPTKWGKVPTAGACGGGR